MSFFSDLKAAANVQRIKHGGTARLSLSQVTCLIVNMTDARKNLPERQFNEVYGLYRQFRKATTKIPMDKRTYTETAVKIIKIFDAIAPYERYSGGNELEMSFMMDDIRQEAKKSEEEEFDEEDRECIAYIIKESATSSLVKLSEEDAKNVLRLVRCNYKYGKTKTLELFDSIAMKMLADTNSIFVTLKISYISGILISSGVISREEANELNQRYTEFVIKKQQDK